MKEITKNQATAIWQIFFVLWLTVGSIVCFNIHCITSEPPIYAPMFAITPLYLIEFYFDHPYTVQAILFQNFVLILMPALLWFLTYKSVFKQKIRKHNHSYDYDSWHRFVSILRLIFYNRIFFHIQSLFSIVSVLPNQFNNKNRINFCNG